MRWSKYALNYRGYPSSGYGVRATFDWVWDLEYFVWASCITLPRACRTIFLKITWKINTYFFVGLYISWAVDGDVPYRPTGEAADAGQVEEDEDDDAIAVRRARVRERLRAQRAVEVEVLEVEQEEIAKWVAKFIFYIQRLTAHHKIRR